MNSTTPFSRNLVFDNIILMPTFCISGEIGDWKNWFTVAENEQFDALLQTKMADTKETFIYE